MIELSRMSRREESLFDAVTQIMQMQAPDVLQKGSDLILLLELEKTQKISQNFDFKQYEDLNPSDNGKTYCLN